jgi:hypothetical protein
VFDRRSDVVKVIRVSADDRVRAIFRWAAEEGGVDGEESNKCLVKKMMMKKKKKKKSGVKGA